MLPIARRNSIKDIITEKKSVTVTELTKMFNVTDETIRRDLKLLEEQGFLVKTHGGAFIQDGVENDIDISIRGCAFLDSKIKIAQIAMKLINNGDSIFLDCSTTSLQIAKAVVNMRLTVITNSIFIINQLSAYENIRLIAIGGTLNKTHMCFTGKSAIQTLKNYFVDKAFISCRSLSIKHGITDSNEAISEIRSLLLNQSNNIYLVADYSKFNKTSFISIGKFSDITGVIVDQSLNEEWQNVLSKNHVELYFPQ